ncbi:retrovirus-related pol polyprotein from transposon TNT 1-94 [Tanacetum coccineum]
MTGDRSQITNFIYKFLGIVKFDNDVIAKIMRYGDYQIGNIKISKVYYVEGLGHNIFSVGQFCDSDLEVAFRKYTCFVCNLEGDDLLLQFWETNLYTLSIKDMMTSSPICLLSKASKTKSWPMRVASINRKKYILIIVDDYSRFTWVQFLASKDEAPDFIIMFQKMIQVRLNTPVRNIHTDNGTKKPDLSYLHVFGALCYPNNDSEDLGKLQAKANIGLGLQSMTPATSCSGLIPNTIPQQPSVSPVLVDVAPRTVDLADSPMSTSIDQDAPSTSILSTQEQEHSPIISQGSSSNVRPIHTPFESLGRWTKDHPIANVIGDPSRSVSTRKQLQTDAMWCYFDAFLTSVEPKNFKQAITEPSWIHAMQEEIHEFERLQVWELVPYLDKVMLIKLKWIYKVKTDKFGGVLKNKARLVTQGFRQEEGIDFEE